MKRDMEIEKMAGLVSRVEEFERFFYSNNKQFSPEGRERIKKYIAARYKNLFEWILS